MIGGRSQKNVCPSARTRTHPPTLPCSTQPSNVSVRCRARIETVAEDGWVSSSGPSWEPLSLLRFAAMVMVQRPVPLSFLERSRPPPGQCQGFVGNRWPWLPLSGVWGQPHIPPDYEFSDPTAVGTSYRLTPLISCAVASL